MDAHWDVIIVGQGLAGTTLAWNLIEAGQRVLIVDAQQPVTSSKIAAGLITPITGRRLVLSRSYDESLSVACAFYTRIEERTGTKFFHDRRAVRLLTSDAERRHWSRRSQQAAYQNYLMRPPPEPLLGPEFGKAASDGFAMHAAQLDVPSYLDATRAILPVAPMLLDWRHDVSFGTSEVWVRDHQARFLISCEGYAARFNPYFSWVPFNPAKGDILTVRFEKPLPPHSLHFGGIWLAPTSEAEIFLLGATYDREILDQVPSASAREQLEQKLQSFFHGPYTVLDHKAAVRPIINESRALAGLHPERDNLGFLNGLGSKGALNAPWIAERFAAFLTGQTPLPETVDLRKRI